MAKEIKKEQEIIEEATELVEAGAEGATDDTKEVQEGKGKKFVAGVKKHGKKILVGALAVVGGAVVVAKVLSGRKVESDDVDLEENQDIEIKEI